MTLPRRAWVRLNRLRTGSGVSAPVCTNGVWPPLRPVSVAQKNKPSTMLSSNVQSIDFPTDCMAWRFWTMRQPNGCSTPAPKSSATKQWIEELAQKKKNVIFESTRLNYTVQSCKFYFWRRHVQLLIERQRPTHLKNNLAMKLGQFFSIHSNHLTK